MSHQTPGERARQGHSARWDAEVGEYVVYHGNRRPDTARPDRTEANR